LNSSISVNKMPTSQSEVNTHKRKGKWGEPSHKSGRGNKNQVSAGKEAMDEQPFHSADTRTTSFAATVRFLDSTTCSVSLSEKSTVGQLKKLVVERKGCPAAGLQIFSLGEETALTSNQTAGDCGIIEGTELVAIIEETPQTGFHKEFTWMERALSGHAICRATRNKIGRGEWRVGIICRHFRRGNMPRWQLPLPFLQNVVVEIAPDARAKSKGPSRSRFVKGDLRVGLCCEGAPVHWYTPSEVRDLLKPVLALPEARSFEVSSFNGFTRLPPTDQAEIMRICEL
jgi:hypothetical protein